MDAIGTARANIPLPVVNMKVKVYVEGKFIPSTSRVIDNSSGFDGRSDPVQPSVSRWRQAVVILGGFVIRDHEIPNALSGGNAELVGRNLRRLIAPHSNRGALFLGCSLET